VFYDEYISRRLNVKASEMKEVKIFKDVNYFWPKMTHVKLVNINVLMESILSSQNQQEDGVLNIVDKLKLIYEKVFSNKV
jgi:hypothetical protein